MITFIRLVALDKSVFIFIYIFFFGMFYFILFARFLGIKILEKFKFLCFFFYDTVDISSMKIHWLNNGYPTLFKSYSENFKSNEISTKFL